MGTLNFQEGTTRNNKHPLRATLSDDNENLFLTDSLSRGELMAIIRTYNRKTGQYINPVRAPTTKRFKLNR